MSFDDEYNRRIEEISVELNKPEIRKKIDKFLNDLSSKFNCDFQLSYEIFPEADDYSERMDSEDINIPRDYPTMTLKQFISHIDHEDLNYDVYIDPIYLKKGVNEINDLLTTVVKEDKLIIIPVTHKKPIEL